MVYLSVFVLTRLSQRILFKLYIQSLAFSVGIYMRNRHVLSEPMILNRNIL